MSWFDNVKSPKLKISKKATTEAQVVTSGNLWKKCGSCSEIIQENKLHEAHQVCPYSNATRGNIEVDISIV